MMRTKKAEYGMGLVKTVVIALIVIIIAIVLVGRFGDSADSVIQCESDSLVQVQESVGCDPQYAIANPAYKTKNGFECCQRRPDVSIRDFRSNFASKNGAIDGSLSEKINVDDPKFAGVQQVATIVTNVDGVEQVSQPIFIKQPTDARVGGDIQVIPVPLGSTIRMEHIQNSRARGVTKCHTDIRFTSPGVDGVWRQNNQNVPDWLDEATKEVDNCERGTPIPIDIRPSEAAYYKWDVEFRDDEDKTIDSSAVIFNVSASIPVGPGGSVGTVSEYPKTTFYRIFQRGNTQTGEVKTYCLRLSKEYYEELVNLGVNSDQLIVEKTHATKTDEFAFESSSNSANGCGYMLNDLADIDKYDDLEALIDRCISFSPPEGVACEEYNRNSCVNNIESGREDVSCAMILPCHAHDRLHIGNSCMSCNEGAKGGDGPVLRCADYRNKDSCISNQCTNDRCVWQNRKCVDLNSI